MSTPSPHHPSAHHPAHPPAARRGADLLADALRAAGVECLFTLSGNHVMVLFDALIGSGIRLVHTRHEAAAVHMADAWARLTGRVGVALVTGGPGHANAVGALYTARMGEAPVLLLSGHAPRGQLGQGAFQEMDQVALAAPLCKAAWCCEDAARLADDLALAVRSARAGRPGPVHLSLPTDVLEARLAAPAPRAPGRQDFEPAPQALEPPQARALCDWLQRAQRPLVLAGPGALTAHARPLADAAEAALGVPVIGMESPRGVADPQWGDLAWALGQADAVLLLGKRTDFTLRFGQVPPFAPGAAWAQVDPEAQEIERTRVAVGDRLQISAVADLPSALRTLAEAARQGVPLPASASADAPAKAPADAAATARTDWRRAVQAAVSWRPPSWAPHAAPSAAAGPAGPPSPLSPLQALQPLQAVLDSHPQALLISDGGEFGQWAQAVLRAPRRLINGVAGSIGSALPFALAARAALPPEVPVLAVMGDGTFGFHMAEIDTAVRCGLPFVAVVGNDACWNAEYQIQLKDYGPERLMGCELLPSRYDLAAAALGGHGEWVQRPEELGPAVQRALASGRPAVVNVMVQRQPAPQLRRPAPA